MKPVLRIIVALAFAGLGSPGLSLDLAAARAPGLIGLLKLPQALKTETCLRGQFTPLAVHGQATGPKQIARIELAEPRQVDPASGCSGERFVLRSPGQADVELPVLESDYETPALAVVDRAGPRLRLATVDQPVWVEPAASIAFVPVEQLLKSGLLYPQQGALRQARQRVDGAPAAMPAGFESGRPGALELIASRRLGPQLWLHLRARRSSICESALVSPDPPWEFWLPFYDSERRPLVWFYSRGC